MSLTARIGDGRGSNREVGVTPEHALLVGVSPLRAEDIGPSLLALHKLYVEQMKNDAGAAQLNVNGSVTPVPFSITAENGIVKFVQSLRIIFNDEQMNIGGTEARRFGSAAAAPGLVNGLTLDAVQGGTITSVFVSPVKNMHEFFRQMTDLRNDVDAVAAGTDYLHFDILLPVPVALMEGSKDRLTLTVRDDLVAINFFEVIARGWKEVL